MTPDPSTRELLDWRLARVAALSALNAEALKLIQESGAIEMERLRIELDMARPGAEPRLVHDLQQLEEDAAALRSAREACDERIAETEREIAEIDRRIAAS